MVYAVITGDIIGSTKIDPTSRSIIIRDWLQQALWKYHFELSRGDTFQLEVPLADALRISIDIRVVLKSQLASKHYRPDACISIGLGSISFRDSTIATSTGTAFEFSGRGLEKLKGQFSQI